MAEDRPPHVEILLFSGPRVRLLDGETITFTPQHGAILALLALSPGNHLNRDELSEALWPDEDPEDTRKRLRVALSELRRILPADEVTISHNSDTVHLERNGGVTIDTEEFSRLLMDAGETRAPRRQLEYLAHAVDLYGGPLCPRIYIDRVVHKRAVYEDRILEARRCLRVLMEQTETAEPIEPVLEIAPDQTGGSLAQAPGGAPAGRLRLFPSAKAVWLLGIVILGLLLGVVLLRASSHSLRPEERIRIIESLRNGGSQSESPAQLHERLRLSSEQIVSLGETAWNSWYGRDESAWIERLRPLDADIQNSLRWLLDHDPPKALQLAGALSRYWWLVENKQHEALNWLSQALNRTPNQDSLERARALTIHAMCVLEDRTGDDSNPLKNAAAADKEIEQSHAMYTRLKYQWGIAHTARSRGHTLHALGKDPEAEHSFNEALNGFTSIGDTAGKAYTLWSMSLIGRAGLQGCIDNTRLRLSSAQLFREVGNDWGIATAFQHAERGVAQLETFPQIATHPDAVLVLTAFIDEGTNRLNDPDVRNSIPETLILRKQIARVAMLLEKRSIAVEQLGHLVGPYGLQRTGAMNGVHLARLTGAYIRYIPECLNPPLSKSAAERNARGQLAGYSNSTKSLEEVLAEGGRMSLKSAIAEAAR